jgi:predicted dehydrogenase
VTGLRIGVLGASRIAELAIIGPAAALGHRLVAVAARDRGRAETFARTYPVERVADSCSELLNSGMEGVGVGQLLGTDISEGKAVL